VVRSLVEIDEEEVAHSSESGEDNYESPGSTLSGNSSDFSSLDGEEFFELERAISIEVESSEEEEDGVLTPRKKSFSSKGETQDGDRDYREEAGVIVGGGVSSSSNNNTFLGPPTTPQHREILSPRQKQRLHKLRRKMFRKLNCGRCADTIRGCCDEGE